MVLMLRSNEIFSHLAVSTIYFIAIALLRGKIDFSLLWLWLGIFLGTFLLDIDNLLYWFATYPDKEDSVEAKRLWRLKDLGVVEKLKKLYELGQKYHNTHNRLIFHSFLGQIVLLILAVFVLTSGGNIFASAFIASLNLHLLKDEWTDFFERREYLKDWLFWQIKGANLEKYLETYLIVVTLVFLFLSVLLR